MCVFGVCESGWLAGTTFRHRVSRVCSLNRERAALRPEIAVVRAVSHHHIPSKINHTRANDRQKNKTDKIQIQAGTTIFRIFSLENRYGKIGNRHRLDTQHQHCERVRDFFLVATSYVTVVSVAKLVRVLSKLVILYDDYTEGYLHVQCGHEKHIATYLEAGSNTVLSLLLQ